MEYIQIPNGSARKWVGVRRGQGAEPSGAREILKHCKNFLRKLQKMHFLQQLFHGGERSLCFPLAALMITHTEIPEEDIIMSELSI